MKHKNLIYLDHAASTPVHKEVEKAMRPFFIEEYGNPGSLHVLGQNAKQALEESRKTCASILNANAREVYFTAGGNESVNIAILGTAYEYEKIHNKPGHIITTKLEHSAVLECIDYLVNHRKWKISFFKNNEFGQIDYAELNKLVKKDTALVSIMYANNEIGTIYEISKIGNLLKKLNYQRNQIKLPKIYFHSDASQAPGQLEINLQKLGVDLMTINGSKIQAPKQSGLLYIRDHTYLQSIMFGGGQEKGIRNGTENVAFAVALAKALELSNKKFLKRSYLKMQNNLLWFYSNLKKEIESKKLQKSRARMIVNGPWVLNESKWPNDRLSNNLNISFIGYEGEALVYYLSAKNICVSTGSACSTGANQSSHVIEAIGRDMKTIKGSLRFSISTDTNKIELKKTINEIINIIQKDFAVLDFMA